MNRYDVVGIGCVTSDLLMEANLTAARWAREAGITVVLDADVVKPHIPELLELTDYIVASERFAREFTGETDVKRAAGRLLRDGVTAVVVTAGDQGSFCASREIEFHCPAFQVKVVDTTGAGDVFHGAFDFGLLRGWDLQRTIRFASAVAAMTCRHPGGRAGIPALGEALAFLRAHSE